ncbi:hypothetical protein HAX54_001503, partial [Datura stramonium]|nr:hypothetical protein [Datura stramonium]
PSADDDLIRKNYRRLSLALYSDKNQSVEADGAFKIISEAWSLLSDRTKRMVYDKKQSSSMQSNQHGFHHFSMNPASVRNSINVNFPPTAKVPQPSEFETFWRSCIYARCGINTRCFTKTKVLGTTNVTVHFWKLLHPTVAGGKNTKRMTLDLSWEHLYPLLYLAAVGGMNTKKM